LDLKVPKFKNAGRLRTELFLKKDKRSAADIAHDLCKVKATVEGHSGKVWVEPTADMVLSCHFCIHCRRFA